MNIQIVKLSDINPYYDNPRNNANAVAPVMESIKRFGFIKPIILDANGVIIAGHTRYIAAFQLGMTEVPAVYSDMDEEHARMFRIADNKASEKSKFDEQMLIDELKSMSVPQEMQSFFFEDIDDMLNFSFNSISSQMGGNEYEESVDMSVGSSYSPENYSDEPEDEYQEDEDAEDDGEESPVQHHPVESEGDYDDLTSTAGLYLVRVVDGKRKMKVICPYCGNIEMVEVTES